MDEPNEGSFPITIISTHKNGEVIQMKDYDDESRILIKYFTGLNTNNWILKKYNGHRIEFSFFKINGILYINLNNYHIIDYRKFIKLSSIIQKEETVIIKNNYIGEISLDNCDTDLFKHALKIMNDWQQQNISLWSYFSYFIFS